MPIWKEIFKEGDHIDGNGSAFNATADVLTEIVNKYNKQTDEEKHVAPVVVGHPDDNSPAYGWVDKLKVTKGVVLARFKEVDPAFQKLVNAGRFKNISIALYPDMLLRHVGYLGAIPPAVKGLKPATFGSKESYEEYSFVPAKLAVKEPNKKEYKLSKELTDLLQFEEDEGMSKKFETVMTEFVGWLQETYNPESASQAEHKFNELMKKHMPKKQEEVTEPSFSDSEEFKALQAKLSKLEGDNKELQFSEFFASKSNRLVPAQKTIVRNIFDSLQEGKEFTFSEGEGENKKDVKVDSFGALNRLIDSFPEHQLDATFAEKQNVLLKEEGEMKQQNDAINSYNNGDK